MGIKIKNISKKIGELKILEDINMEIKKGEFVSILGPSGCGKSTLFKLITKLLEIDLGKIELGKSNGGAISYMPQKDLLLPWKTLYENASIPLEISGVKKEKWEKIIFPLIEEFGLKGFEDKYPNELSGGMRQRAGLLRSFLIDSELMLLDEPFGALDALTRSSMQEWLLKIWEKHGRTVLFITHDIDEAIYLSDKIYVFSTRPGRILKEIEVKFSRPRKKEIITTPKFMEYKKEIMESLSN